MLKAKRAEEVASASDYETDAFVQHRSPIKAEHTNTQKIAQCGMYVNKKNHFKLISQVDVMRLERCGCLLIIT